MVSAYDILFAGDLRTGADPDQVRASIQSLFKLSGAEMEKLFSGQPVALKRGLDLARAQQLRRLFLQLGAITWLTEQAGAISERAPVIAKEPSLAVMEGQAERPGTEWVLAPMDDRPLEPEPTHPLAQIDISHIHLVLGQDWSLVDCDRPAEPMAFPAIRHLHLLEDLPAGDEIAGVSPSRGLVEGPNQAASVPANPVVPLCGP